MKLVPLCVIMMWAITVASAANDRLPRPGYYQGYAADTGAHVRLQVRGNGYFSGRVTTLVGSAAVRGRMGGPPVVLTRLPGGPALLVTADTDTSVRGQLEYNGQAGQSFAITRGFSGRIGDRAPLARDRINATLTGGSDLPGDVEGAGFFSALVRPNGRLRLVGRLPDNTPLSRSLRASAGDEDGIARVPVLVAWGRKAQRHSLAGEYMLRTPPNRVGNHEVLRGTVDWRRPTGEPVRLRAAGGRWPPTARVAGRNVLGNGIDQQRFILARIWQGQMLKREGLMDPHPRNRPDAAQPLAASEENLLLKVNPRNGFFTGSFQETMPGGRKQLRRMAGIITGYFIDQYEVETGDGPAETVELFGTGLIDLGEQGSGLVEIIKPPPGLLPE
jgi:hypothetical protein